MTIRREDHLIPLKQGHAISAGWTSATENRPVGVTWHWTATRDLRLCTELLGGPQAQRRGEASAHFGVGRTGAEGIHRYVPMEHRSWHCGIGQVYRWDGRALGNDGRFKGARTTIGIETVHIGNARGSIAPQADWIHCADTNGRVSLQVPPWPAEQVAMMIELGREVVDRWRHIKPRDHHGHHDLCPGYKIDVLGFPFAEVLRGVYPNESVPDIWTPLRTAAQRQEALILLGYDLRPSGADGDWGRRSDSALRRFQREQGMREDGMWTVFTSYRVHDVMPEAQRRGFFG